MTSVQPASVAPPSPPRWAVPADMGTMRDLARQLLPAGVRRKRIAAGFETQVAATGEAELAELAHFVRPGDLALDVGANAGVYAWQLARLGARVIAFEPNPEMADHLALATGADAARVEIRRLALSDMDGEAVLTLPENNAGLGTLRADAADATLAHFSVETRRLDGLGLPPVAFIKIDVEGHEEAALAGGLALIARDLPVLLVEIEERHNAGGLARITAQLSGLGYTVWFLVDGKWLPFADFALDTHQRVADIAPMDTGTSRRDCRYFNNFLFLPPGKLPPRSH